MFREKIKIVLLAALLFAVVFCVPARATDVIGDITSNTTWLKSLSPYHVTGEVNVKSGATLTIEAGVTVEFASGTSLNVRDGGILRAVGTPSDIITFTSDTVPVRWNRVFMDGSSSSSKFTYCLVEYSTNGIYLSYTPVVFDNCTFRQNTKGLVLAASDSVKLKECTFTSNEAGVYYLSGSKNTSIESNTITFNKVGIDCGLFSSLAVLGSRISSNEVGIHVNTNAYASVVDNDLAYNKCAISVEGAALDILSNRINSSEVCAVLLGNGAVVRLWNNTLINNVGYSLYAVPGPYFVALEASENKFYSAAASRALYSARGDIGMTLDLKFYNNVLDGLYLEFATTAFTGGSYVEGNTIIGRGAGTGIGFGNSILCRLNTLSGWSTAIVQGSGSVNYNNLGGNTFGIGAGLVPMDGRRNYWGGPSGPGVGGAAGISGNVLYDPWLKTPISANSSEAIYRVALCKDVNYAVPSSEFGVLERVFVTMEGDTRDTDAINWAKVIITSEADPAGISVVLTETGLNSGTYNGDFRVNSDSSNLILNLIKASAGKKIWVTSAFDPSKSAVINVVSRSKWRKVNSPEDLPITLILPPGTTLEVEPGVTVNISYAVGSGVSGLLELGGMIIASGEPDSRITFTSCLPDKHPGDWYRLFLNGAGSRGSVFNYCDLEYGGSTFYSYTYAAIYCYNTSASVTNCRFYSNKYYGAYSNNSTLSILGCNFENNGVGIGCTSGANLTILDNVFINNGTLGKQGGVSLYYATAALIKGNTFSDNNPQGIFSEGSKPEVRFNNFLGNGDYGVFNQSPDFPFSAPLNWWGTSEGPDLVDSRISPPAPEGPQIGDNISAFIYYEPFLKQGPVAHFPPSPISGLSIRNGNGILERLFVDISGTDASAESVNWATVKITSEADRTGITLDLVETGLNTGAFSGEARVVANPSDDTLELISAEAGKSVFVSSVDDPLVGGSKSIGNISTWEAALSPEILPRSTMFLLPSVCTLKVEPGVTVEFDDSAGLEIKGVLFASGEASKRITFTSRRDYPSPGNWQQIYLNAGNAGSSVIRNCDISYGTTNINVNGCSPLIKNNNIGYASQSGIYCSAGGTPIIEGNDVFNNLGNGIYLYVANPRIFFNRIRNNGTQYNSGIFVYEGSGGTIEGNVISSNEPYGICNFNTGGANLIVRGNTIEAGANSSVRYCVFCGYHDPAYNYNHNEILTLKFNNLIGYDGDDYGVYMRNRPSAVTPPLDATLNYWSGAKASNYVVVIPSMEGLTAYSPPTAVSSVKFFKYKDFSGEIDKQGILGAVFISAEGVDSDPAHYNWTTVLVSNESDSDPTHAVYVDLIERGGPASGTFGGAVRLNNASYSNKNIIGCSLGNSVKVTSVKTPLTTGSLTVISATSWEAKNSPERVPNGVTLQLPANGTLSIEAGSRVEVGYGSIIDPRGIFIARGKKNNRILFTALNPNPYPGAWGGFLFYNSTPGLLAYADVKYAAKPFDLSGTPILIAMTSIESSSNQAVFLQNAPSARVVDCDFLGSAVGVKASSYTGTAKVNYNNNYGVATNESATTLEARYNWWGSSSRPYVVSRITGKVTFEPYLVSPNVPGGPIASDPRPWTNYATNDANSKVRVNLFDPEDVNLRTITVEVNGAVINWGDPRLTYEAASSDLIFSPSSPLTEGVNTFEVVGAYDTFDEFLRSPLTSEFIVDLTSPEVVAATVTPFYARAGSILITAEASDSGSGLDHSVTPEVMVRYGALAAGPAAQRSFIGNFWTGTLSILSTFENGPATVEVRGFRDMGGNQCVPSLEAGYLFIDTVAPVIGSVPSPPFGITIEGPSVYNISWEGVYDPTPGSGFSDKAISIYLLVEEEVILITGEAPNTGSYAWQVPPYNLSDCRIRVMVRDRAGNITYGTSEVFSINTINPYVLSTDPYDGEINVPVWKAITIGFNKPMSTESVEKSFSTIPYTEGTFEWTASDATVTYRSAQMLNFTTTYEVVLSGGPTDKFGHILLNTPVEFSFMTVNPESEKPTISRLRFNGRAYRYDDVISRNPNISAVILDNLGGVGVAKDDITFRLGTYIAHPDTYDPISGEAVVRITGYPLGEGLYTVTVEAMDRAGNWADPWTGRVRVMYGEVQLMGSVLSYPTPFKPLSGRPVTIAYTLSIDADVTIYMYDVGGRVVLTKKFGGGSLGGRAGYNSFDWDGTTDFGLKIGNGIYVYKITSGKRSLGTGKLVVYD